MAVKKIHHRKGMSSMETWCGVRREPPETPGGRDNSSPFMADVTCEKCKKFVSAWNQRYRAEHGLTLKDGEDPAPKIQTVILTTRTGKKAYFTGKAGQIVEGDIVDHVQAYPPRELPPGYSWETFGEGGE